MVSHAARRALTLGWCEEAAPEFVLTLLRRGARLRCLGLCEQPEEPAAAGGLSSSQIELPLKLPSCLTQWSLSLDLEGKSALEQVLHDVTLQKYLPKSDPDQDSDSYAEELEVFRLTLHEAVLQKQDSDNRERVQAIVRAFTVRTFVHVNRRFSNTFTRQKW